MEISLANLERHSILFIGSSISLTPENPGPVFVDVGSLTEKEASQVMFNIHKGVLSATGSLDDLRGKLNIQTVRTPTPAAVKKPVKDNRGIEFRKILAKKIGTIKKEVSGFSVSDLRKLMDLEKKGKNRKRLNAYLGGLYQTHTEQVAKRIKSAQDNSGKAGLDTQTFLDDLPNVVESGEEKVEFTLPDKE